MKTQIVDADVLREIRWTDLAAYLRAQGWQESTRKPDLYSLWTFGPDAEYEVQVPLRRQFQDFAIRIAEVLRTLESVESRSQLEILRDLWTASADVVRIRVSDHSIRDGSLPLDDAVDLVHRTRDLLLSAASAAVAPRAHYGPRRPAIVEKYIRLVRMGQTEEGSYVLTIVSGVPPGLYTNADAHLSDYLHQEPFSRQVTLTLARAMAAVRLAVERATVTGAFEAFKGSVSDGVSANLCEAVAGIMGQTDGPRRVGFDFSWARSRALRTEAQTPSSVYLDAEASPVLLEAARLFREMEPIDDFELVGPVVALDRPAGQKSGNVSVVAWIRDQPRKVNIALDEVDYENAIRAHGENATVSCIGRLLRQGRNYVLEEPRTFTVLPNSVSDLDL